MNKIRIFSYLPNPRVWKSIITAKIGGIDLEVIGDKPNNMPNWLWDFEPKKIDSLNLNKIDLLDEEEVNKLVKQLELKYKNKLKVSSISAAQRKGTKELMRDIGRYLESTNG